MAEAQEAKDAKEAVAVALQWLRGFVVVIGLFIALAFIALMALVIMGQVHGAEHTQEILKTVTQHDESLQHILSNTCAILKQHTSHLPSWCLPKKK